MVFVFCLLANATWAQEIGTLVTTAKASFERLPDVELVSEVSGNCGADPAVNRMAAYCTSQNTIFLAQSAAERPEAAYVLAHLFGHATQVQHGVADVALATIRANRDQEASLRAEVTRQVECIAGVFWQRAGFAPASLFEWFDNEPFSGSHWGRNPLSVGPEVSIGLTERDAWFQIGQTGDIARCAGATFGADLLVAAIRTGP